MTQAPDGVLTVFGEHEAATLQQMRTCMEVGSVHRGVICADGHKGYAQPVGGVIAYERHVSVSGVGFDIGCGNLAARTDVPVRDIQHRLGHVAKDIGRVVSFGLGRVNEKQVVDHELFDSPVWKQSGIEHLKPKARAQLGTVGGGNHYVDLFADEEGMVWIGVHFGSRGFGHQTATKFLKLAGGRDGMDVAPALVEVGTDLGDRYVAAMRLAGEYAYAGREWVADQVRRILGARTTREVHNHHTYAREEEHDGRRLWVVRKGATPAFPGQAGFVGGSMGDDAVILEGVEGETSRRALYSTVHGAGRLFSRRKAKETFTRTQMDRWLRDKEVMVVGGDLDESPMAYRRLDQVLAWHRDTIRIAHRLRPVLVLMAAAGTKNPYKD